ncbi:MAG: NUDIX hydrolase [Candidatus Uhrbacteria bacterium GW2011_GWF2_41_16]|uniref:NUDIX hydrolase n=2 Tax=Candidatus Uhriibacteriota TaxID=1752732 RepID=A0A0G0VE72_9BACT|nr:MAG: NUDIX hydrolase [Candidatus Uhrbacteria bacterium GW2011_GWC2_41_11]KKR97976.1 MAG: NUDIX hydrolase [Candidatus Uhrbacteria bacterium GW2011_GWF2_41_16]
MLIECTTLHGDKKMISKDKLVFRPAGYAIVINDGKVLLCNTKSTGKYWFPGGSVDLGKKLEDAIRREVREETGIEIEVEKFLLFKEMFFYYEPSDEAYQNFSFFYLCKPRTIELLADDKVDQEDESEKPRWIDLKSIKKEEIQTGAEEIFQLLREFYL